MNQPLAAIVSNGYASLCWLDQSPPNVEEARSALEDIVRQGHRASEVITRIRALIKKGPSQTRVLNANELIEEILDLLRPQLERQQIALRTELLPDLSSISGDSVQLQQVVLNLVLNAIQAVDKQEEALKELVLTSRRQAANEIIVHDSGKGIDSDQLDDLFQP
jgi:C4-dicarboxylate-specific signal transduction histidine kinase